MLFKTWLKPDKSKIIIFIILFSVVFFIPYLKSSPAPDAGDLIVPGHYPLVFIFLASLVVIMDIFTGTIVFRDIIFLSSFLVGFFVLYLCSCILSRLLSRFKKIVSFDEKIAKDQIYNKEKYVLDLEKTSKSE